MKRTKLDDRTLPSYTRGEEIFNMVSHIVGAGLSVIGLVVAIVVSAIHGNGYGVVSSIIYGLTLIELYTMSAIYHGLHLTTPKLVRGKKVLRIIDHCSIYVLIAGSYTPYALCTFREYDPAFGWSLFAIIWILAAIGVTFDAIDLDKFKAPSKVIYFLMGWFIIIRANVLPELLTWPGTILLVLGGVVYSVGTIFFALGTKVKWMHSIFHIFIVVASILQFLSIVGYVL